jgi:LemA protein
LHCLELTAQALHQLVQVHDQRVFLRVAVYNRLVALRNRIANAFGQIDVQLKRRYDLVPNLVEVARAYLKHESATLEAVI